MKKISFVLGLLSLVFLVPGCGDDDGDGQPDQQSINLIGEWELQKISNTDIFDTLGCDETDPTTIEFKDNDKVIARSFEIAFLDECEGPLVRSSCHVSLIEPFEYSQGNYIENSGSGMILFNDVSDEIDETDDFIPPPMNVFSYKVEGNSLTLITADPCLDPPVEYVFEKN